MDAERRGNSGHLWPEDPGARCDVSVGLVGRRWRVGWRVRWDEAKDRTEKSDGLVIQGSHQPYSTTHLDIGLRHVLVAIKGLLALPIQGWAWQDA
jgi:hypothetical protein